jgi:hypothetical protein
MIEFRDAPMKKLSAYGCTRDDTGMYNLKHRFAGNSKLKFSQFLKYSKISAKNILTSILLATF